MTLDFGMFRSIFEGEGRRSTFKVVDGSNFRHADGTEAGINRNDAILINETGGNITVNLSLDLPNDCTLTSVKVNTNSTRTIRIDRLTVGTGNTLAGAVTPVKNIWTNCSMFQNNRLIKHSLWVGLANNEILYDVTFEYKPK